MENKNINHTSLACDQPSASFDLCQNTSTWPTVHQVQSDPENRRITVVVSYMDAFPSRCVEVLHATWADDSQDDDPFPSWSRGGSLKLDIDHIIPRISIEEDIVCIPLANTVILWDWRLDLWATLLPPRSLRGAWVDNGFIYIMDDPQNVVYSLQIPPLGKVTERRPVINIYPTTSTLWNDAARCASEHSVLSDYKPSRMRARKLCAIVFWSPGDRSKSLRIIHYGKPGGALDVVYTGAGDGQDVDFGVQSAALQTVEIDGVALRAGRRHLARLVRPVDRLEFRVRAYSLTTPHPTSVNFTVPMTKEWSQAEVYDTCTVFGRILIRQYDDSSDDESGDEKDSTLCASARMGMAVLDFD